jgi:hypothetical protein
MARTVEIIVAPTGSLTIEAVGFKGADCEKVTRALEEALGAAKNRSRKPEYYASTTTKRQQKLGG